MSHRLGGIPIYGLNNGLGKGDEHPPPIRSTGVRHLYLLPEDAVAGLSISIGDGEWGPDLDRVSAMLHNHGG